MTRQSVAIGVTVIVGIVVGKVVAGATGGGKGGKTTRGPPAANPGTAGGARAGKPFTLKGKTEIDAANAARHGGINVCENCGADVVPAQRSQKGIRPPGNERHRDHKIPRSKGGDGDPSNGEILCRDCNLDKGNKL